MVGVKMAHFGLGLRQSIFALALACVAVGSVAATMPTGLAEPAGASARLANPLFQNDMVLQRDHADPIWGRGRPNVGITVTLAGDHVHTRADSGGYWSARLPELAAGGPYTMTIASSDGALQTVKNVLVGDVWLCAGQSNMVLPVWRTLNQRVVIKDSTNSKMRMLTVSKISSAVPRQAIPASDQWLEANPRNVPDFSATCYYFARALQKTEKVPMGMVVAAWGGSSIEPWMTPASLRRVGGYAQGLSLLSLYAKDRSAAQQRWARHWEAWWTAQSGGGASSAPWNEKGGSGKGWKMAPLERGAWQHWGVAKLARFTGMLWYRTTVHLTQAQAAHPATLSFIANETDET